MSATYPELDGGRVELWRWGVSATVVLLAHGLAGYFFLHRSDDAVAQSGSPVVMIDFAPVPAAPPAPKTDLAPGPQEMQPESEAAPAAQPVPEKQEQPVETPPDEAPDPQVTLPKKVDEPPQPTPPAPPEVAHEASPTPTAPPSVEAPAERPAGPEEGRVTHPDKAAIITWQRLLVAHLQRYKRYPEQARAHREEGIARVGFTIDREGHLLSSHIVHSSGFPALDEATLAMIQRAAPLPRPPATITDAGLSFVVPIRYSAR